MLHSWLCVYQQPTGPTPEFAIFHKQLINLDSVNTHHISVTIQGHAKDPLPHFNWQHELGLNNYFLSLAAETSDIAEHC